MKVIFIPLDNYRVTNFARNYMMNVLIMQDILLVIADYFRNNETSGSV